ncbi:dipeptidyl peptidase 8-like isoform X1 [Paramormyrops kingsleyae]|uniref:dipeptidyl peptidase 8-like isoform X1 n=1 Tax=Paramormyrops kingsleyae TaxID=1676925 RepID=UPI000CD63C57|nr:dipeptidyl peptidase 8-like isoform X1 [Paramormyrops kingsleyae]
MQKSRHLHITIAALNCTASAGMSSPAVDVEWGGEEAGAGQLVNDRWPPGAPESQERFFVEHHTWSDLRNILTDSQRGQFNMVSKPPHEFQFVLKNDPEGLHSHRVYFLAMTSEGRENTLFYAEIPKRINKQALLYLTWKPLLLHFHSQDFGEYYREDELLRERKRIGAQGIMSYDFHRPSGSFMFQAGGSLYTLKDGGPKGFTNQPLQPETVPTSCHNIRMDPKLCPVDPAWFCFVHSCDLWIGNLDSGAESRLTFAHKGESNLKDDPKSAGMATFLLQEEFDRYTGYWWCPVAECDSVGARVLRILYEENDESDVEVINVTSPLLETRLTEAFRYPRAGTGNPKSTLKLLEVTVSTEGEVVRVLDKRLVLPMVELFPGTEYITRAGWTADGRFAWALLLNRPQTRQQLVLLPPALFIPDWTPSGTRPEPDSATPFIVYQETTDIWINTHDILHFLPQREDGEISVIVASEVHTGFRHLYRVTSRLQASWGPTSTDGGGAAGDFLCPVKQQVALTWGDWEVLGRHGSNITVDEERGLLFFQGTRESPLEHHLYVTSWLRPVEACRITKAGHSHTCRLSQLMDMYISRFSSEQNPPCVSLFRLSLEERDFERLQGEFWASLLEYPACPWDYVPPELFNFESRSGQTLHGMFYRPHKLQPGKRHPVVVFVYGGPQVQLVNRRYKGLKHMRLHTLASLGYCVVTVDNRGSCHRGLAFESALQNRMGQVEIDDQVEALEHLSSRYSFMDMDRVAIHGWSYGGFLSLMGLLQRPDLFKVAIAGAPVTMWTHYDTGYTERYMGLPEQNQDSYQLSSVTLQAHRFPSQPGRLLLLHGVLDENVHFAHTNLLLSALVRAGKPYQLQLYPQERHSIRLPESGEHYELHLLHYLQEHLGSRTTSILSAS